MNFLWSYPKCFKYTGTWLVRYLSSSVSRGCFVPALALQRHLGTGPAFSRPAVTKNKNCRHKPRLWPDARRTRSARSALSLNRYYSNLNCCGRFKKSVLEKFPKIYDRISMDIQKLLFYPPLVEPVHRQNVIKWLDMFTCWYLRRKVRYHEFRFQIIVPVYTAVEPNGILFSSFRTHFCGSKQQGDPG